MTQQIRDLEAAVAEARDGGYYDQAEQLQADLDHLREGR